MFLLSLSIPMMVETLKLEGREGRDGDGRQAQENSEGVMMRRVVVGLY